MTPEEKLCSRTWRIRNSAGLLWGLLSLGFLTGVGFLIRGVKAKNRAWILMGVGFLVVGIGLMVTTGTFDSGTKEAPIRSLALDIWGWTWFTTFVGGIVAASVTNKKWLLWKAHAGDIKWYAKAGAPQQPEYSSPGRGFDPNAAAGIFTPPRTPQIAFPAPTPVPAIGLDVNSASAQDLVSAWGVDSPTANRILEARQAVGSFTSFEQFISKAQVPPHLLIPHRANINFGSPGGATAPQPAPPSSSGSQSARRLFD